MTENHIEVAVSKEVIRQAKADIEPYADKIGKRGKFDGSTLQKIMGRIGEIMTGQYLEFESGDDTGINTDGFPDNGDYRHNRLSFDAKTSFSYRYREKGWVPPNWGLLVPDSQFRFCPHDFYIRCAVDSDDPEEITKICFVGYCTKEEVAAAETKLWECLQPREETVLMRIVAQSAMFSIVNLKEYLDFIWGEQCRQ